MSNTPAELLLDERHILGEAAFAEIVVWRVPLSVRGSAHEYRYRLALVVDGECVLRTTTRPARATIATLVTRSMNIVSRTPSSCSPISGATSRRC